MSPSSTRSSNPKLTIDSAWRDVADTALPFMQRFT